MTVFDFTDASFLLRRLGKNGARSGWSEAISLITFVKGEFNIF